MSSELQVSKAVEKLKAYGFVHSIMLFGSVTRGEERETSDIDICIIEKPGVDITLEDKINVENSLPENVDISFFHNFSLIIRHRVLTKGEILYSENEHYIYQLLKEVNTDLPRYRKFVESYHSQVMEK